MSRAYNFNLPLHLGEFYLAMATRDLAREKLWYKLPDAIRAKIDAANAAGNGITITKEDLDQIPDKVWVLIEPKLPKG